MSTNVAIAHRENGNEPLAVEAAKQREQTAPIVVSLHVADPVSRAGIEAAFVDRARVRLVAPEAERADVALVVVDEVDDLTVQSVRRLRRSDDRAVVLVVSHLDDNALLHAVEAGASGLVRRVEATTEGLLTAIRQAAEGCGTLPPDLVGRLMSHVGDLHDQVLGPQGLRTHGLSDREIEVLRLVAEGLGTSEIADQLSYSERTIKNVIQGVTTRLHLNNRSHAVAYALRQGLI